SHVSLALSSIRSIFSDDRSSGISMITGPDFSGPLLPPAFLKVLIDFELTRHSQNANTAMLESLVWEFTKTRRGIHAVSYPCSCFTHVAYPARCGPGSIRAWHRSNKRNSPGQWSGRGPRRPGNCHQQGHRAGPPHQDQ